MSAAVDQSPGVELDYVPAGPTIARFHHSPARVRGILGPIGSAKSVCCAMELFLLAIAQKPYKGVRYSRWGVIRNTYPELRSTTIKTWQEWFPAEICNMTFGAPITGFMRFSLGDGTWIHMELVFIALDQPKHVSKLRSLELTGAWINEASEVHKAIFDMLGGRIGRYPPKRWGGPTRDCTIMDTNAMDTDHWWYWLAERERPQGHEFFRQPPALLHDPDPTAKIPYRINPEAENRENQPKGDAYWLDQVPGKSHEYIRVYLMAEYGAVQEGQPVYPEYSDFQHCSWDRELVVNESLPIRIGWDYGRTPAAVIGQLTSEGRLLVLDELVVDDPLDLAQEYPSMGVRDFAAQVVRPYVDNHYHGMRIISIGDPAGKALESDNRSAQDYVREAGFPIKEARTNAFIPRREAVALYLGRMTSGQPGFALSAKCEILRKGFISRYKYRKMAIPQEDLYSEEPIKNAYSHPHDALQYLALETMTAEQLLRAQEQAKSHRRRRRSAKSWRV